MSSPHLLRRDSEGAPARARALDLDELGLFTTPQATASATRWRIGVTLFWVAIACLLVARVFLFDPSAPRTVGSFTEQTATPFPAR